MPPAGAQKPPRPQYDDLDNYDVDAPIFSDDDNPVASPPASSKAKKRTGADAGLGIDEEVEVQKRACVPNVKLDEDRLLGPAGIPKLRERARKLRFKGKGHEFSDASRLLSLYQLWLDDLFPKARFLDALAMVEKTGHKKRVVAARNEWINEGKPKPKPADDDEDQASDGRNGKAPIPPEENTGGPVEDRPRPLTPAPNSDVPDEDDLYDATPRAPPRGTDMFDGADDLEALIGEAEQAQGRSPAPLPQGPASAGLGLDDLDALIAEAEEADQGSGQPSTHPPGVQTDNFSEEVIMAQLAG